MAELIVFLRSRELTRVPILAAQTTIGREVSCDVVIDNAGVSRTHAMVLCHEGQFRVRDLGSQNGITVNGKKVEESPLEYGDVVGINKFKVCFSDTGGPPPELLVAATRQVGKNPSNVVQTMTVNTEAARRMQEEFIRRKQAVRRGSAPARREKRASPLLNGVLVTALIATLAAIAVVIYARHPGLLGM
jgi:pSer/pThr/pTyr-binding forkhead associated (FHA) protein